MQLHEPCRLIEYLANLDSETEWVEFKQNNADPDEVGQYVSALANSAMLHDQQRAYIVFGISDAAHELVGTTVRLSRRTVSAQWSIKAPRMSA